MKNTENMFWSLTWIIKENGELYRSMAKSLGLSDCAFWILYVLQNFDAEITQSDICSFMYIPKQTVNSALKKLINEGYIELCSGSDNRSKFIRMTAKGALLAEKTVKHVIDAELSALDGLTDKEQATFIALLRKYTDLLKNNMSNYI